MNIQPLHGLTAQVQPQWGGLHLAARRVWLWQDEENDGWWSVECPSLPGCISQGETPEAALQNIREAMEGWLAVTLEAGQPVPAADAR